MGYVSAIKEVCHAKIFTCVGYWWGLFASGYLLAQNPKEVIDRGYIARSVLKPSADPAILQGVLRDSLAEVDKLPDSPNKEKQKEEFFQSVVYLHLRYYKEFADAAANPIVAPEIAGRAIEMYDKEVRSAKSAVQASEASGELSLHLQAVQVVQNARIIELLGQLVAQKK